MGSIPCPVQLVCRPRPLLSSGGRTSSQPMHTNAAKRRQRGCEDWKNSLRAARTHHARSQPLDRHGRMPRPNTFSVHERVRRVDRVYPTGASNSVKTVEFGGQITCRTKRNAVSVAVRSTPGRAVRRGGAGSTEGQGALVVSESGAAWLTVFSDTFEPPWAGDVESRARKRPGFDRVRQPLTGELQGRRGRVREGVLRSARPRESSPELGSDTDTDTDAADG